MKPETSTPSFPSVPHGYSQRMAYHAEAALLVDQGSDVRGRPVRLMPEAAQAWQAMKNAAESEGIPIAVISSYRSFEYQRAILSRKLTSGQSLEEALRTSAYPGYSEHHSGRALDLCTPDDPVLEERFAGTKQFAWLATHAETFGFRLSYPAGNSAGIIYEPWHWCWHARQEFHP